MKMANQRVDSTGKVGAVFPFTGGIIKLSFPKCSLTFPVGHAKRWPPNRKSYYDIETQN